MKASKEIEMGGELFENEALTTNYESTGDYDKVTDTKPETNSSCLRGLLVAIGAFTLNVITFGSSDSFGVLLSNLVEYFGETRSSIAGIGSVYNALPLVFGPVASLFTNKFGFRSSTIFGGILTCIGFVLSSFSNSVILLYLTYGIIAGVGVSFPYLVSTVVVSKYFKRRRALILGICDCGVGVGTFIFSPLLRYLISIYGWRGAVLISGGIVSNIIACGFLFRGVEMPDEEDPADTNTEEDDSEKNNSSNGCHRISNHILTSLTLLKNWKFTLFCMSKFVSNFWNDVPFMFIYDNAILRGELEERASFLVSVIGFTHIFGNLIFGFLGDRKWINVCYLYCASEYLCGIVIFLVPFSATFISTAVLSGLYGIFSAGDTISPTIILRIVGLSKLTNAYGIVICFQGIATLMGPPFAGWLFDISGSYNNTFFSAGACTLISGLLFHIVPLSIQIRSKPKL